MLQRAHEDSRDFDGNVLVTAHVWFANSRLCLHYATFGDFPDALGNLGISIRVVLASGIYTLVSP